MTKQDSRLAEQDPLADVLFACLQAVAAGEPALRQLAAQRNLSAAAGAGRAPVERAHEDSARLPGLKGRQPWCQRL